MKMFVVYLEHTLYILHLGGACMVFLEYSWVGVWAGIKSHLGGFLYI
jgi:hypothetical protein